LQLIYQSFGLAIGYFSASAVFHPEECSGGNRGFDFLRYAVFYGEDSPVLESGMHLSRVRYFFQKNEGIFVLIIDKIEKTVIMRRLSELL